MVREVKQTQTPEPLGFKFRKMSSEFGRLNESNGSLCYSYVAWMKTVCFSQIAQLATTSAFIEDMNK
jgi:hypothetical protein